MNKTPLTFIKEKGLYNEYVQWSGKKKKEYGKNYFRSIYWGRAISNDIENRDIYRKIRSYGYQCSPIVKLSKAKRFRVSLVKDGYIAKIYIINKQSLCEKVYTDKLFQEFKTELH